MLVKLLRMIADRSPTFVMRMIFNFYPPHLGAGISVEEIAADFKYLRVSLKLRFYNRNYVGTQYGGSIYAMTDPYYMYLLLNTLGSEYIVWDKGARIDFVSPGKTDLRAEFHLDDSVITTVKEKTQNGDKYIFDLPVTVYDENNKIVAEISKTMYVRKKKSESTKIE